MKILSKFEDYYDYACAFRSDETTYVRDFEYIKDSSLEKILSKFLPQPLFVNQREYKDRSECVYFKVIVLAGKCYPFASYNNLRTEDAQEEIFCYTYSEFLDIKRDKFQDSFSYSHKMSVIREFFDLEYYISTEVPIMICQNCNYIKPPKELTKFYQYKYDVQIKLAYNPCLKQYKFPLDGRLVLQEVETFINRHKEMNIPDIRDDKVKLASNGFDKFSFKKQKEIL
jgi:hypothetical protein